MNNLLAVPLAAALLVLPFRAEGMDRCTSLPRTIKVLPRSTQCGPVPTVVMTKEWKNSFSAAFRWDDGSSSGQDRSPFALEDSSAKSSPYKTQRRVRTGKADYLCYGKFLNRKGFPVPVQLTIKRTPAPKVSRYCVKL